MSQRKQTYHYILPSRKVVNAAWAKIGRYKVFVIETNKPIEWGTATTYNGITVGEAIKRDLKMKRDLKRMKGGEDL
jgi:hypothetical protein